MRPLALALLLSAPHAAAVPQTAPRAATPVEFDLLVRRLRDRPTYSDVVNGHSVSVVVSDQALPGQNCPGGRHPRLQAFLAERQNPAAPRMYYMRLAALCVGSDAFPDLILFALDAGEDGVIADWVIGDLRAETVTNGMSGNPTAAQRQALEDHRAALVQQLLSH